MILSDIDIRDALQKEDILIRDFDENRLQPASYDILLGHRFIVPEPHSSHFIDPVNNVFPSTHEANIEEGDSFTLHPGVSVLGTSLDYFGSDMYLIQLSGKSSLARIGLIVHNTAGLINPGHFLHITLELCNLNNIPIILRPRMPIAQLLFCRLSTPSQKNYRDLGRYSAENWKGYVPAKTLTT